MKTVIPRIRHSFPIFFLCIRRLFASIPMFFIRDMPVKNSSAMSSHISRITILILNWIFLVVDVSDDSLPSPSNSILSLPEPDQSLETIIKEKKFLMDKTKYLEKLVDEYHRNYLLTRPNGFGKTIFLQIIKKFFLGEKEFFKNTTLYKRGNKEMPELKRIPNDEIEKRWVKYPVIYFNFANIIRNFTSIEEFRNNLKTEIKAIRKFYEISSDDSYSLSLSSLLYDLHNKFGLRVVVLVDDYDSSSNYAMHVIKNETLLDEINHFLGHDFFQTLKNSGETRFVLVTGVFRLAICGSNGGMDAFYDLTYDDRLDQAFGFTQEEMITNLHPNLDRLCKSRNVSTKDLVQELSQWYGNHRFSITNQFNRVIHPVSAIRCLKEGSFGIDSLCANRPILFIVEKFYENYLTLNLFEDYRISYRDLIMSDDRKPYLKSTTDFSYEVDFPIFMLLHGYLTITHVDINNHWRTWLWQYNDDWIHLNYPNIGVKEALKDKLAAYVPGKKLFIENLPEWTERLRVSVQAEDISTILKLLSDYGFYRFSHTADPVADRADFTSRFMRFFQSSKIPCQLSDYETYADIQTSSLPTNYIFRVIYKIKILRLFYKLVKDEAAKFKVNKVLNDTHFITLNFANTSDHKMNTKFSIKTWISVSYKNGKIECDKLQASSFSLKSKVESKYCKSV